MLEIRIKQGRRHVPLFDLPAQLGRERAAREISETVEGLIAFLDDLEGDPDFEADDLEDDFELSSRAVSIAASIPSADVEMDAGAWVEWHTMRGAQKTGPNLLAGHEDAEDDDPLEASGDERDTNNAEDEVLAGAAQHYRPSGPGCPISDPDFDDYN